MLTFLNSSQYILGVILIVIDQSVVDFAVFGGFLVTLLDMAPEYAGIISGISATLAYSTSVMSPILAGYLTTNVSKL